MNKKMSNSPSVLKNNEAFCEDDDFFNSTFFANIETSLKNITNGSFLKDLNESFQNSALNVSALCCDEEISGYDKLAGQTWIYPTNYPVRHYQFNIIQATIIKNTLVSLPTGLGKTFIAAVIMYNFYRWYPVGKIIFTAPTRPLVAQQIDACYNIVAIPPSDTIEMTGNTPINTRKILWKSKRVIFATPQVIFNDIQSGICPAEKIRCIVFDEAHRARGNYAYCQIVSTLTDMGHKTYRVLALSATPGSKVEDVINVVKNLHIAHLELRSENCLDVAPYSHSRKINTTVIPLGPELTQLRSQYVEILDGYAQRLKQMNILPSNISNLSKGRVVMLYKEYQNRERGTRHPQHNSIMKDFTLLISLFHGLELLTKHGSRVFLNFFDEHPEKSWIQSDNQLTAFLERLRDDLGVNPLSLDLTVLPDGSLPEIPQTLCYGHPKFDVLRNIILDHFNTSKDKGQETKAIVFCEYRESVNLVNCLLLQCRPLVKAQMFVGQGAGKVSQKQQLRVMHNFREGVCNTLVATCVAEEGLDVGSVDLIICFDISTRSPVRLVQRCGRTGRERGGRVYILVTEGKEHQTLLDCMRQRDGLNQKILNSKDVERNLYKVNPRMIPHGFTPECQKMHITVAQKSGPKDKTANVEKNKKGQMDLRNMLGRQSSGSIGSMKENKCSTITDNEFQQLFPNGFVDAKLFPDVREFWAYGRDKFEIRFSQDEEKLNLATWLEWQRILQPTVNIDHSADTEALSELLQYADAKRLELPASTQNPTFNTQALSTQPPATSTGQSSKTQLKIPKKKQTAILKSPSKKDGDIRALFNTATKSTKSYTKLINDLGIQNDESVSTTLMDLLVELSIANIKRDNFSCHVCRFVCDCKLLQNNHTTTKPENFDFLQKLKHPDIKLLNELKSDFFINHVNEITLNSNEDVIKQDSNVKEGNCTANFDLDIEFTDENGPSHESQKTKTSNKNFDIGDIDDIFADSLPDDIESTNVEPVDSDASLPKETLGFFGLESVEDIFTDSDIEICNELNAKSPTKRVCKKSQSESSDAKIDSNQCPLSPSILTGTYRRPAVSSPILCSTKSSRKQLYAKSIQCQTSTPSISLEPKRLLERYSCAETNELVLNNSEYKTNTKEKSTTKNSQVNLNNTKSFLSITQLIDMINKTNNDESTTLTGILKENLNDTNFVLDRSHSPSLLTTNENIKDISNSPICVNQGLKTFVQNRTESSVEPTQSDNNIVRDRSDSPILLTQADKNSVNDRSYSSILITQSNRSIINDKSNSPILLSQAEKKVQLSNDIEKDKIRNLFVLDSDSDFENDFEETVVYDMNDQLKVGNVIPKNASCSLSLLSENPSTNKRKERASDDDTLNFLSPYFTKRRKVSETENEITLLKEKVKVALNKNCNVNYIVSQKSSNSQKENILPRSELCTNDQKSTDKMPNVIQDLQVFRREKNKTFSSKNLPKHKSKKSESSFEDSDDDFISHNENNLKQIVPHSQKAKPERNSHKIRKKIANQFLELEAELSDASRDSGDELTDDSVGSIAEFICDENETLSQQVDMQAHYLKSVKSPVKGVFKIPHLPPAVDTICSQTESDNDDNKYEMDSFCVDSHIGLTQVNDLSELEIAEMRLEAKRKKARRKKTNNSEPVPVTSNTEDDCPVAVKRKTKRTRKINSDSEDSS